MNGLPNNEIIIANKEVERKIVGAIIVDPLIYGKPGVSSLNPDDFYQANLGIIWKVCVDLLSKNKTVNITTVEDVLKRKRKLKAIGGSVELIDLVAEAETVGVSTYAEVIKADANRRYALIVAGELAKKAHDPNVNPLDLWSGTRDEIAYGIDRATDLSGHYEPVTLADVQQFVKDVTYLWDPWIPNGLLTVVVGAVESGKSCLGTASAGLVIAGGDWLDGQKTNGRGRVVWVEQEAAEALLVDRVKDWGIDGSKIIFPGINPLDEINLLSDEGWGSFERATRLSDIRLIVIDSLGGAFMRENDPEVKTLMKRLAALARDTGIPILLIHHPRKLRLGEHDTITLDRVRGHSGIIQFPRSILAIEKPDPTLPEIRRLKQIKLNMGVKAEPTGFELVRGLGLKPHDAPEEVKQETQLDRAIDLVKSQLHKGAKLCADIYDMGEEMGISGSSLRRAKGKLNVVDARREGKVYWSYPAKLNEEEWWSNV